MQVGRLVSRETVRGDGAAVVKVGNVEQSLVGRMRPVRVAVQLIELLRLDRRMEVRGVHEVVELQHLCGGRGATRQY
jgi:hypothetical protein